MARFSANLALLLLELLLLKRIKAAHRAGFKAVELHWPYNTPATEVRDVCARYDMELLALNTPAGNVNSREFGLAALVGREAGFKKNFDQAATYARFAGASSVHVMAGIVLCEQKSLAKAVLTENLRHAALCAPDITLLLEPINQRDKSGYFYLPIKDAAEIIAAVGAATVKIMFDIYHVGVSQRDVLRRLNEYFSLICRIQIGAVPSRHKPDEGEIAYPVIFKAIDALGYQGRIGCEYKPRTRPMRV